MGPCGSANVTGDQIEWVNLKTTDWDWSKRNEHSYCRECSPMSNDFEALSAHVVVDRVKGCSRCT